MTNSDKVFHKNELIGIFLDMDSFKESSFPTPEEESFQVGLWSIVDRKVYEKHIHKSLTRTISNTAEFIFVLEGELKIHLYSPDNNFLKTVVLGPNNAFLQFQGGHEIVAESKTKFFEIKQGPYLGRDADKFTVK